MRKPIRKQNSKTVSHRLSFRRNNERKAIKAFAEQRRISSMRSNGIPADCRPELW